jgi:uncharacterized protein YjbI with pentapeptide repeats
MARIFPLLTLLVALVGCGDDAGSSAAPGCRLNSDCAVGQVCDGGQCSEPSPCSGEECGCGSDAECGEGERCEVTSATCVRLECADDPGCGLGERCEGGACVVDVTADRDRDGVPDGSTASPADNCPSVPNPEQTNSDFDALGDACDPDDDNDGIGDEVDDCPTTPDPGQADANGDGLGNACDPSWRGVTLFGLLVARSAVPHDLTDASVRLVGPESAAAVVPQADGTFEFLPVRTAGQYQVVTAWPGWVVPAAPVFVDLNRERVDVGQIGAVHESESAVTAVPLRGQARVVGALPDGHGGTIVRVLRGGELFAITITDEQGAFALLASPGEVYRLEVHRDGYEADPVDGVAWDPVAGTFMAAGAPLEPILLTPLAAIDGSITVTVAVGPGWIPAGDRVVRVRVEGASGAGQSNPRASDGEPVSFTGLTAGSWLVFADRPGFATESRLVELTREQPDATVSLEADLIDLGASDLNLVGETLLDSDLRALATLVGARLDGAVMRGSGGGAADLRCMDLRGASLVGADLAGAQLSGSDLTGGDLAGADLTATQLYPLAANALPASDARRGRCSGAASTILRDADFRSATLDAAEFADPVAPLPATACPTPGNEPTLRVVLDGATFEQASIADASLGGMFLRDVDFSSALLRGANFEGACLQRASFVLSDLSGVTLDGADLQQARLISAVMSLSTADRVDDTEQVASAVGADFSGATLLAAVIERADLTGASFVGSNLSSARIFGADLTSADMAGALLVETLFADGTNVSSAPRPEVVPTRLEGADLSDVTATGASFSGTDLRATHFYRADLRHATFSGAVYDAETVFTNASLARADFSGEQMGLVDLAGADLESASLVQTVLDGATLTDATVDHASANAASFVDADLSRTRFDGASLDAARFAGATFTDTWLAAASLRGARFSSSAACDGDCACNLADTNLREADLSSASLVGCEMHGVTLDYAILSGANLAAVDLSGTTGNVHDVPGALLIGANLDRAVLDHVAFLDANLSGASTVNTHVTRASYLRSICPSGNPWESTRTPFCAESVPIKALVGDTLLFGGSVSGASERFVRPLPDPVCQPYDGDVTDTFAFRFHAIVNPTLDRHTVRISADWNAILGSPSGIVVAFTAGLQVDNPNNGAQCLAASARGEMALDIDPGVTVIVVVTTAQSHESLVGPGAEHYPLDYQLFVTTEN